MFVHNMAWVIIGGLSSLLLFTLILVPAVYLVIEEWKVKVNRFFGRRDTGVHPVVAGIKR